MNHTSLLSQERIMKYLSRREAEVVELLEAMAKNDRIKIRDIAHKVKGNALLFGFADLGKIAEQLETASDSGTEENVKRLCEEFADWVKEKKS